MIIVIKLSALIIEPLLETLTPALPVSIDWRDMLNPLKHGGRLDLQGHRKHHLGLWRSALTKLILHENTVRRFRKKWGELAEKLPTATKSAMRSFRPLDSSPRSSSGFSKNIKPWPAIALKNDLKRKMNNEVLPLQKSHQSVKRSWFVPVLSMLTPAPDSHILQHVTLAAAVPLWNENHTLQEKRTGCIPGAMQRTIYSR